MTTVDLSGLKACAVSFKAALAGKQDAEKARKSAQQVYSDACQAMAEAIPGEKKKIKMTVDGVACELTFSKAGKGGGWSCRGLPGVNENDEPEEVLDLDAVDAG